MLQSTAILKREIPRLLERLFYRNGLHHQDNSNLTELELSESATAAFFKYSGKKLQIIDYFLYSVEQSMKGIHTNVIIGGPGSGTWSIPLFVW